MVRQLPSTWQIIIEIWTTKHYIDRFSIEKLREEDVLIGATQIRDSESFESPNLQDGEEPNKCRGSPEGSIRKMFIRGQVR